MPTFKGSCHCGAVTYELELDPAAGTARCNCSICTKAGWWSGVAKPAAFRILSGRDQLTEYGRRPTARQSFCKVCGIRLFHHGDVPAMGGEYYSVNLNTLDDADLSGVPVSCRDGRSGTWAELSSGPHVDPFKPSR